MTRMLRLSTSIGGSGVSISASRLIWALSSPFNRGESAGRSDRTGTATTSAEAPAARPWNSGPEYAPLLTGQDE
jgi:hypothetical protein